ARSQRPRHRRRPDRGRAAVLRARCGLGDAALLGAHLSLPGASVPGPHRGHAGGRRPAGTFNRWRRAALPERAHDALARAAVHPGPPGDGVRGGPGRTQRDVHALASDVLRRHRRTGPTRFTCLKTPGSPSRPGGRTIREAARHAERRRWSLLTGAIAPLLRRMSREGGPARNPPDAGFGKDRLPEALPAEPVLLTSRPATDSRGPGR